MRAVWLRAFGPPSTLEPGEAPNLKRDSPSLDLIDVECASVTFVETQVRAGRGPFPVQLPMIPGNGVGGRLDGRRVVASLGGSGGYAEQAIGREVFDVPAGLPLDHAANREGVIADEEAVADRDAELRQQFGTDERPAVGQQRVRIGGAAPQLDGAVERKGRLHAA